MLIELLKGNVIQKRFCYFSYKLLYEGQIKAMRFLIEI